MLVRVIRIRVFDLLQQVAVEVVAVASFGSVKADFLTDKAAGVVVEQVVFVTFVFDAGEQQQTIVIAVIELAAIGINAAAEQGQVVGIFVTGNLPAFVPFGDHLAIGVVAPGAGFAAGQDHLAQASKGIPLVAGDGAILILSGCFSTPQVIAVTLLRGVGQGLVQ